jgi:hypothetical protein
MLADVVCSCRAATQLQVQSTGLRPYTTAASQQELHLQLLHSMDEWISVIHSGVDYLKSMLPAVQDKV